MMGFVEFDGDLDAGDLTREQIELLVRELFRDRPSVQSVKLTTLPGGHIGLSGVSILLAQPYGVYGNEQNPLVIRIGPKAAIDREEQRYRDYVEPNTGLGTVQRRLYATVGPFSAIAYDYLDQRTREDELWRWYKQFRDVIDSLERSQQHVALRLWLSHANQELRTIIAQIAPLVRHTTIIIVTEHPFRELNTGLLLQVAPLTDSDVAAYVRYKQLPLDTATVRQLYDAS